jgi:hypothetical protein
MSDDPSMDVSVRLPPDLRQQLCDAAGFFWHRRGRQAESQGQGGRKDQGARAAVTGGKQMSGFEELVKRLLEENGVPSDCIFLGKKLELPGYLRPTKMWDLLVVHEQRLLAAVEFKSQVGPSFGNNFNNRVEEAIGSATDIWKAYRENAFHEIPRPWLGYVFMLEDCPRSNAPVSVREPHFPVFPVFKDASYAQRYEELCRRLIRERLYNRAVFLMSKKDDLDGTSLREPSRGLAFMPFVRELVLYVKANLE